MLRDEVTTLLTGLGTSAVEIAQALENKGIKGFKGEPLGCPLSELLMEQFPGTTCYVNNDSIVVEQWDEAISAFHKQTLNTSSAVQEFIVGMDNGHFPALVKDEWERGWFG